MKEIRFDIDDAGVELTLFYRLAAKYKESRDPALAEAGIKLEQYLCKISSELLTLKVEKGSCGVKIPVIDEDVELHHAIDMADRIKDAVLFGKAAEEKSSSETKEKSLPAIEDGSVDNMGLF